MKFSARIGAENIKIIVEITNNGHAVGEASRTERKRTSRRRRLADWTTRRRTQKYF